MEVGVAKTSQEVTEASERHISHLPSKSAGGNNVEQIART